VVLPKSAEEKITKVESGKPQFARLVTYFEVTNW